MGFGPRFNPVHPHELRFGELTINAGTGALPSAGTDLADRLAARFDDGFGEVTVYPEDLATAPPVLGSTTLFGKLKPRMDQGADVLVYIHGYNVSFAEGAAGAAALQHKLQKAGRDVIVVLFTWPSDGQAVPFRSYKKDRDDAAASGLAFSRAFQKLHSFLTTLPRAEYCGCAIHLLCHSMGNFVLENTLWHLRKTVPGKLPRIFGEIVLASADVDNDAFETENKLGRLTELARRINVYFNRGDEALAISDATKGNPDRLGEGGPKHPLDVPSGVVNLDCSEIVGGLVEHSYYLDEAFRDVSAVLDGAREDRIAKRTYVASSNAYRLAK
jgi:esterase/lipase superfamily enzyme